MIEMKEAEIIDAKQIFDTIAHKKQKEINRFQKYECEYRDLKQNFEKLKDEIYEFRTDIQKNPKSKRYELKLLN